METIEGWEEIVLVDSDHACCIRKEVPMLESPIDDDTFVIDFRVTDVTVPKGYKLRWMYLTQRSNPGLVVFLAYKIDDVVIPEDYRHSE